MRYDFTEIEKRWQEYWEAKKTFRTPSGHDKPKYYVLDMFPYPSGSGLHVGHPEGYTATDIVARYKRMKGFNVLHPMGWDAFGLPAERYAMKTGIHPAETTEKNIATFKRQLQSLGFSYDWEREINTTDEKYYRWTQWIFLLIFNSYYDEKEDKAKPISALQIPSHLAAEEKREEREAYINERRLAYIAEMPVNWCGELGTVLANEEVEEWTSKGYTVERKPMRQWMLRITAYASRLLDDLTLVDWPNGTLELQKNWIGKSNGAEVEFGVEGGGDPIKVYTTRPDTLFGVTYMVLAPEHPLVDTLATQEQKEAIEKYRKETALKSELDRQMDAERGKKTGVFTGGYALHPFSGEKIPVWIADYVLISYGTGAIMAVPAHDERDHEFALEFKLPIRHILSADGKEPEAISPAYTSEGINFNSDFLDGLTTQEAKQAMIDKLEAAKIGRGKIHFRLRDWLFSRQRYWGEPIPVSQDAKGSYYQHSQLPLTLPPSEDFQPAGTGESPLAKLHDWVNHKGDDGRELKRETNTMPQWAGSSWYYLRYVDPTNSDALIDPSEEKYWLGESGVDLYVGGAEHAVLHLLYARFWHKLLYDYGYLTHPEPFKKLVHQGLILGEDGVKMSKSRGNVINPDDVVAKYGADSFRLFEMFMGPLEQMKPWSSQGIEGVFRFLMRVWRVFTEGNSEEGYKEGVRAIFSGEVLNSKPDDDTLRALHSTVKKVTGDIEKMAFNTAISQMMIFINHLTSKPALGREGCEMFLKILSPFAPHIAEELWSLLGNSTSISLQPWPEFDPELAKENEIEIVFQINGKVRSKAAVSPQISEEEMKELAMSDETIAKHLVGKEIKKTIVVKKRLVNIVAL